MDHGYCAIHIYERSKIQNLLSTFIESPIIINGTFGFFQRFVNVSMKDSIKFELFHNVDSSSEAMLLKVDNGKMATRSPVGMCYEITIYI